MEKFRKYLVNYKTQIITENGFLEADGFSSVKFINIGSDEAYILKNMPLTTSGETFSLENREFVEISQNIPVEFVTTANPKVIAIKSYYQKI